MPGTRASRLPYRGAAAAALAAVLPAAVLWGFTVDDALIVARYAHHLATGEGYVFNARGPSTDGVTPLGFAHLLAPFAAESAERALGAARVIGLAAWIVGAAFVGWRIAGLPGGRGRWLALLLLALSAPLAAWSSAGLETGLVCGLVTVGVALRHAARAEPIGPALLALAAGLRPELLPFALVGGVPDARGGAASGQALVPSLGTLGRLALVVAPFVSVAIARFVLFGRAAPLAAVAKQSSLGAGAAYAVACFLLAGPLAVAAPMGWRALSSFGRWLLAAICVHFLAIAGAGGDWMPLSRLAVPVLPSVAILAAEMLGGGGPDRRLGRWATAPWVTLALALAMEGFVWTGPGFRARRVLADRQAVIDQTREALAGSKVIGTLDIGWVGAAAPRASVVDFAGVTDPMIAVLPGGHTSKPIPDEIFAAREVDTLVLLLGDGPTDGEDWTRWPFARGVERWVALSPGVGERMAPVLVTAGRLRYVVLRRR
jgi:hypothetical protein